MNEAKLAEIEARANAATPGPWTTVQERWGVWAGGNPHGTLEERWRVEGPQSVAEADADLMAHAREDVPSLVAEVRRLREIIAGRTTPPTDAEIASHAAAGGGWQVRWVVGTTTQRAIGDEFGSFHDPVDARQWRDRGEVVRWIAVDADGCPCARPTGGA